MDQAKLITKAIGYIENGGHPSLNNVKRGKTGEMKSIFQFTPATWKNYSHEVFGKEVPMTPDTETAVAMHKVSTWLQKGYKPEQIFSMWNAGVGEPNAYTGQFSDGSSSKGLNRRYGQKFDVPEYVNKGMEYLNEFSGQQNQEQNLEQNQGQNISEPLQKLMAIMSEAQQNQGNESQTQPQVQPKTGLINQLPQFS